MTEITSKLPWTLGLVGVTTIIAFVIGTLVGVYSAWRRGGRLDAILPPTLFIVSTVPVFFVGLLLRLRVRGHAELAAAQRQLQRSARHRRSRCRSSATCSSTRCCPGAESGGRDRRPVGVLDAQQHDHDDRRGLREDGPRPRGCRPAGDVRLRRAQRDPAQPHGVRDAAGLRARRLDRGRVPVLLSRRWDISSTRRPPITICR